ncbi:MAG: DUF4269 domain-containing protein [Bacteroidia bacterium]|nr:DUF4269 domain-containing protein [Bacteroidia bacterium]
MPFDDISYLRTGNERQQAVYDLLSRHQVMERLAGYDPILAGTVPIGLDVPGSDLDILCCWKRMEDFWADMHTGFRGESGFYSKILPQWQAAKVCFELEGWPVEIFGQGCPTRQQRGYLHLVREHELLTRLGPKFRAQVMALRQAGVKTEPAFAAVLGLSGDPYEALLRYQVQEIQG